VPTPNPQRARDEFFSVQAVSPDDVWAVGGQEATPNSRFHTLIEHYDGGRWSVVPSPDPGPNGNELFGVGGATASSLWAVGQQQGEHFPGLALVERWDGHVWRLAQAPQSSSMTYDPYAVTAFHQQLLAAGDQENDAAPQSTLSFDRGGVIPSANVGAGENDFYGIDASGGNAWAVGRTTDRTTDLTSPLAETLRDGRWSVVPTPAPGGSAGTGGFGGVTVLPSGEAWAVGAFTTSTSANQALIERYVPAG
jgi:hypothetical protein